MGCAAILASALVGLATATEFPDGAANPYGHSPVRIFLDFSNLTSADARFESEVRAALAYWEAGGNGRLNWTVRFQEVASRSEADVVFWLLDAAHVDAWCGNEPRALGCASVAFGERATTVEIVAREESGSYRPYALIRSVSEHEIGHALGFAHSSLRGDIMFPTTDSRAETGIRPGEIWKDLGGLALILAILVGLVWLFLRTIGRHAREAETRERMLEAGYAACPAARDGSHVFFPVRGQRVGDDPLEACERCGALRVVRFRPGA